MYDIQSWINPGGDTTNLSSDFFSHTSIIGGLGHLLGDLHLSVLGSANLHEFLHVLLVRSRQIVCGTTVVRNIKTNFFLEWIEITLIMLPIVGPMIGGMDFAWIADSGMDASSKPALIWFAILCAVALQTSFLTPPVGFAIFFIKGVAPRGITLKDIYKGVVPFVVIQLIALGLVLFFPKLVTWLPGVSY